MRLPSRSCGSLAVAHVTSVSLVVSSRADAPARHRRTVTWTRDVRRPEHPNVTTSWWAPSRQAESAVLRPCAAVAVLSPVAAGARRGRPAAAGSGVELPCSSPAVACPRENRCDRLRSIHRASPIRLPTTLPAMPATAARRPARDSPAGHRQPAPPPDLQLPAGSPVPPDSQTGASVVLRGADARRPASLQAMGTASDQTPGLEFHNTTTASHRTTTSPRHRTWPLSPQSRTGITR